MSSEDSFQDLMARLQAGDQGAASRIFELFARRLVGLARSRLTPSVRAKVDPEDIVQSALRSFFVGQGEGDYQFSGWNDLWNLLAVITLRKCGKRVDYYRAARRDIGREAAPPTLEDSVATWEPLAREPTPSEAVMLLDVTESLLRSLGQRDRQILELTLQGANSQQLSAKLGCSERTVERVRERIRKSLEQAM
jgi:RNA polymerase sigma-70 factor (ECF subfamily)